MYSLRIKSNAIRTAYLQCNFDTRLLLIDRVRRTGDTGRGQRDISQERELDWITVQ